MHAVYTCVSLWCIRITKNCARFESDNTHHADAQMTHTYSLQAELCTFALSWIKFGIFIVGVWVMALLLEFSDSESHLILVGWLINCEGWWVMDSFLISLRSLLSSYLSCASWLHCERHCHRSVSKSHSCLEWLLARCPKHFHFCVLSSNIAQSLVFQCLT